MRTRLNRPLLAAVLLGAVVAGGAVYTNPALAAPATAASTAAAADDPTDPTTDPTTTAPTTEPTTPPDTTKPTGSFKLSLASLWIGQRTTLTLGAIGDDRGAAGVTRVVTWGDGGTNTLPATQTTITKQYTKAGRFPVTLTLTDAAGNRTVISSTVAVTVPGTFKLNKTSVWHGERFTVAIGSVPTGTTRITLNSGDGYTAVLAGKNQTVTELYYHRYKGGLMPAGPVTLTAVFTNKNGSTTPIVAGKVTIKRDVWSPKVTITKPAKSNRASSWKTIKGTAVDKGSGIPEVIVIVLRKSGSKVYCYNAKNAWVRIYADTNLTKCFHYARVTKGKWALTVKGQKRKTELDVLAVGADWADHTSNTAERYQKLTRS